MSHKSNIAKSAGIVGLATLMSRILGLVRDLVTAYFFGAGLAADAFFVAFRIPNLLRRLLAEGALTVSFIPIFTEYLTRKSREEAFEMVRAALTLFSIILALVTVAGMLLSPYLVMIFAPGFTSDPEKFQLTVLLTRVMFPYIFLVGLVALAMGILNSLNKFAAPALSPVMLNLGMIGSIYLFRNYFDPPIMALAVGVLVGGTLQVVLQIPYLIREGRLIGISFNFNHPALKRIGLLMVPAAFGAAMYQISVFVNTLLASFLPEGSVSYLYYADRLMQFPLGVFAVAVATAVLPTMSRQTAEGDMAGLKDTVSFSLRLVLFITIPATIGLIVMAQPLIQLLLQHGRFVAASTRATATALIAYAVGLCALSAVQILVRVFYSLQDTKTPVKIAMISLTSNIVVCLLLMKPMQHNGLALASSIGSMINFVLLVIVLRRRLGPIGGRAVAWSASKNTLWALVMGSGVYLMTRGLVPEQSYSNWYLGGMVGGATLLGMGLYLGQAALGRAPEMSALLRIFRKRVR
jgi:putative peptidoglycan lipid II flippase